MAGDSLMGPPALFHRSVVREHREDGTFIIDLTGELYVHTDPSQCNDWCPKGWLAAYPGNSPRDYVDIDTGELGTYADHVDWMQRRATARLQRRDVTARPLVEQRSEAWARGELQLQIAKSVGVIPHDCEGGAGCAFPDLPHIRGRVGSISPEVRTAGSVGDAGSSPAASTVRPLEYDCGVCENGAFGANCLTCGRGMPTA